MNTTRFPHGLCTSVVAKITVVIVAIILLASAVAFFMIRTISYRNLEDHVAQETEAALQALTLAAEPLLASGDRTAIHALLVKAASSPSIQVARIYGADRRVIDSSRSAGIGRQMPEAVVSRVFNGRVDRAVSAKRRGSGVFDYSAAAAIRSSGRTAAVLFVRADLRRESKELESYVWAMAYSMLGIMVLGGLAVLAFIYFSVLRPLGFFVEASKRIRRGDYRVAVQFRRRDEFGQFADTFNIMANEMLAKTEALKRHSERLELEMKETREKFLQAQKMEAVGRLAGGVAHDFNNILTGILGYSEVLAARVDNEDPVFRYASEIRKAAYRAAGLTTQLLAFSRKQAVQPRVLLVNDLIKELGPMLERLMGEEITVECTTDPRLWLVKVDPTRLDQVIMNLSVNARDAMPRGGRFRIETANLSIDESDVQEHPEVSRAGDYVTITVGDSGVGMDAETLSHMFEPFYTTKETGKGTGLGLSTVYGIVNQADGFIGVDSRPGGGTTFTIYLPRAEEDSDSPQKEIQDAPAAACECTETILVAEDDATIRALIAMVLRENGYRVFVAADGERAKRLFERNRKRIDLVITDVIMPRLDGRGLADHIHGQRPDLKVIFMSGYTSDVVMHRGVVESKEVLLDKPIAMNDLLDKVRAVLDEG